MSVEIKRNHFYKKQVIGTGVNVNPLFTDLPQGTATTATLGTSDSENIFVLSTEVPDEPNYGEATLTSAALSLYSPTVDFLKSQNIPQISGYQLNSDITINEGGYTTATGGNKLAVYSVKPNNSIPYLSEEFEGDAAGFGEITRMGGNALKVFKDPYILKSGLKQIIRDEEGSVNEQLFNVFAKQLDYYDATGETKRGTLTLSGNKAKISFGTTQQSVQSDTSSFKLNLGRANVLLKTKYFKYFNKDLGGKHLRHVKYNHMSTSPSSVEGNPAATKGNTIFQDFYATRNFSNPFDTTDTDPMLSSVIELSSEQALNGGQSLRMYHNWGYSVNNPQVQKAVGVSGNMNPQCARVSLYDIPMPDMGHDIAKTSINGGTDITTLGQSRAVIPEIRLPMNLTQLAPNVLLSVADYGSTTTPWTDPLLYWGSTATAYATGSKALCSQYEQSFLRSVVVTFSNYKPKAEHTTVDQFLDYGLKNFYRGRATENIVGGFILTRFGIDGASESGSNRAYAFPLPVQRNASQAVATGTASYYISGKTGMAKLQGSTNNSSAIGNVENSTVLSWGRTFTSLPEKDQRGRYAEIPMNSWFTARIFTDIFQRNGTGSTTKRPYSATITPAADLSSGNASYPNIYDRGVSMRVVFDTESQNGMTQTMSGTTMINTEGVVVDSNNRNLPFLDIPFPCGNGTASAAAYKTTRYTFLDNPDLYPKHMTIWVQNYPWVSGGNTTNYSWHSLTRDADNIPNPEGASREVELYVDSVNLYNYTPEITNLTANNDTGVVSFASETFSSPSNVIMSGNSATKNNNDYYHRFVGSYPIDYTISCNVSGSGDTDPRIIQFTYPTQFDTGYLENAGTVSIAGTGINGSATISTIDSLDSFTMSHDPTVVGAASVDITFTSTGTAEPPVNKADMISYEAGHCLVMGMDDKTNLPIESNTAGYFLWSDFSTSNWSGVSTDPLIPDKTATQQGSATDRGAIYSQLYSSEEYNKMGGGLYGFEYYLTVGSYDGNLSGAAFQVSPDGALAANTFNLGSGASNPWLSYDAGRQKGFMYLQVSGATNTDWVKRENILTSVRITECEASSKEDAIFAEKLNNNQIKVNDASVFNYTNEDETYIIYLSGDGFEDTSKKRSDLSLDTTLPPVNNIISFKQDITLADDGDTPLMLSNNLYRLLVSPQKFYMTLLYNTPATRVPRSYDSLCLVNEIPSTGASGLVAISGTTFNETTYTYTSPSTSTGGVAGLYKRPWSLAITTDNNNIILDQDFGYGAFDEDANEGGELFKGPVYLEEYNYYRIGNCANLRQKERLNIGIYYNSASLEQQSVTFYTDDYAGVAPANPSKTPIIYWEYLDMPPVLSNLRVSPSYDLLSKGTDLYELDDTNLNAVTFNWDEADAGDIWYRYLITDTGSIDDKYHNVTSWTPLNEAPPNNNLATVPVITQYSPWNGVSTTGNVTVGSDVRSVVEGQGGYAVQLFDTTNGKVKLLGDATTYKTLYDNGTEWTLVMHWTPSAADKDTLSHIASEGNSVASDPDGFNVHKNTSNLMEVQIGAITMTGSKYIVCDGSKPTSIIVTLDTAKHTTAKLYVDGILDATSTTSSTVSTGRYYFVIGGLYSASARGTTGFMEEVLIYNRALEVIESSSEYVYNTTYTLDGTNVGSGNDPLVNNARLFAADYHNFRGTSPTELGMTQSTSWRTTLI